MNIEIRGLKELQADLKRVQEQLPAALTRAVQNSALDMTRSARINAPIDRGALRSSIMPKTESGPQVIEGIVGTNREYGVYQELGTRPFWPNMDAIRAWALRKGIDPFLVARSIAMKGIKAKEYLLKAFNENKESSYRRILEAIEEVLR